MINTDPNRPRKRSPLSQVAQLEDEPAIQLSRFIPTDYDYKCQTCLDVNLKHNKQKALGNSHSGLLGGSFHDSLIRGRTSTARKINAIPFSLSIKPGGTRMPTFFDRFFANCYSWDASEGPAPYVGSIDVGHLSNWTRSLKNNGKLLLYNDFPGVRIKPIDKLQFTVYNNISTRVRRIFVDYDVKSLSRGYKQLVKQSDGEYSIVFMVLNYKGYIFIVGDVKLVFHNVAKDLVTSYHCKEEDKKLIITDPCKANVEKIYNTIPEGCTHCYERPKSCMVSYASPGFRAYEEFPKRSITYSATNIYSTINEVDNDDEEENEGEVDEEEFDDEQYGDEIERPYCEVSGEKDEVCEQSEDAEIGRIEENKTHPESYDEEILQNVEEEEEEEGLDDDDDDVDDITDVDIDIGYDPSEIAKNLDTLYEDDFFLPETPVSDFIFSRWW